MANKKSAAPEDEKFEHQDVKLFDVLAALDRKDYMYYRKLTPDQQKKIELYTLVKWISSVKADSDLSSYYLMNTQHCANTYLFDERVSKHPELIWMMLCACSPGLGKKTHNWIPHLNHRIGKLMVKATVKEVSEYFAKIYKNISASDISDYAREFSTQQNHKYKLAKMYPGMKLTDLEILATVVTEQEVQEYEADSGN